MLIGGKWVDKPENIEVHNPYDDSLVDTVPAATVEDAEEALQIAGEGFETMRELPAHQRSGILKKASSLLEEKTEEFSRSISEESGKTIKDARGEVARAIQTMSISSEEANRISGETVPFDSAPGSENRFGFYLRVPLGVVSAITPFNAPLNLAIHKLGPALAAGNSVILKPPQATPLTVLKLGKLLLESGLPPKALSIVTGDSKVIGDKLITDPRIAKISFTGSYDVGLWILKKAGLKKVTMELGSNSAVILMGDGNVEQAAEAITKAGFANAGQICISVQRILVQRTILEKFIESFLPLVKKLRVGNQLDEETDVGPMINEATACRAEKWVKEAVTSGGKMLLGGERDGTLFQPTVLMDVPLNTKVICEEVFAPVVVIIPFATFSEAIDIANDSRYGLQAGIYTQDINQALKAVEKLEVGGVMINHVPTYRIDSMPYGGVKGSGLGREGVKYAIQEMTEIKLACFNQGGKR